MKYKKDYKYQLVEDEKIKINIVGYDVELDFIKLDIDGNLTIKKGYAWDGASGAFDTKTIMLGALVHDSLYQLLRNNLLPIETRILCDKEFKRICLENGMFKFRANYVYKAVRTCGRSAAEKPKKIYYI